eukprot:CAMPEP_0113716364 /NCGR_PEP_ID=MMETSP0038_2-20120614/33855_1 /TAXON_ID=2898 /ORGANISM="Cryptomonas paramecium" /LENGTH=101 /DNA_ID=CAMNT_0000643891 /DNA_START=19 /DNA_END=321 /DNA_ORIENTATION=+ /assembly_acc=CAM_ASM_000170
MNSKWHERVALYTKRHIFFTNDSKDIVRDVVPLDEVKSIAEKDDSREGLKKLGHVDSQASAHAESIHAPKKILVIETDPGGYNSGRTYLVKTVDPGQHQEW